jgi:RNA polymerase sigma-70 factor (ECF subfamily)
MVEETDENLVKLAQNGDRDAFQMLMQRHQRRIFNLCYGMLRNKDDAADLVQEAFIKAYKNIDRFKGNSKFYTWLYRIAKNACIDFIRKQKRRKTVDFDDSIRREEPVDGDETLLPSPLGINPAKVAGRKELLEQIEAALDTLSDNHREILILREIDGLAYQEIADTLEISIGTVMSRLYHARKYMQNELSEYIGDKKKIDEKVR